MFLRTWEKKKGVLTKTKHRHDPVLSKYVVSYLFLKLQFLFIINKKMFTPSNKYQPNGNNLLISLYLK